MSIPTSTNYIVNNSNYLANTDLINVFVVNSTIVTNPTILTKYKSNSYDLAQIFVLASPAFSGSALSTGYTTIINGTTYDLAQVFQKKAGYSLTGTYTVSNNVITFTGNGTITFYESYTVNYILVGGGGGGGGGQTIAYGGGGGGQVLQGSFTNTYLNTYTITVGSGGIGGINFPAQNGLNSSITSNAPLSITSSGGLGAPYNTTPTYGNGGNSGSSGTGGVFYNGFPPAPSTINGVNGGGGARSSGQQGVPSGNGGLNNTNSQYGGGGGGGSGNGFTSGGSGVGGGGNGGSGQSGSIFNGTNGTANTGGGGGGSSFASNTGGNGGSGVVILSLS
jgi:hypothetical protein